jgi:hypothetical protein
VYVITPQACQVLDPASGKTMRTFTLTDKGGANSKWGWIAVDGDFLIAATRPMQVRPVKMPKGKPQPRKRSKRAFDKILGVKTNADYASSSKRIVVMDRKTGKVLWSRDAVSNFRHNAITPVAGKVFCIDAMSIAKIGWLKRRGLAIKRTATIYALNARTGKVIWKTNKNVFGTWLSYSAEHDVLVQCGSPYRDRAFDEARTGITVYRAKTGRVVWSDIKIAYDGPLIIRHDQLITNGSEGYGLELMTGKKTGWTWSRKYGCNTAIASENLLTFRSGAAGYYDLKQNTGTGNFGGFKSSCTANLIVADGVLNAPDYTRTCSCSYQNQSSLALVHMPEVETWTYGGVYKPGSGVGLNFGAPGDRLADNGTFWVDVSEKGSATPLPVSVKIDGATKECFNNHSSIFAKSPHAWVGASGLVGASSVTIDTRIKPVAVRLYFAEPDANAKTRQRVFSVWLNGRKVLRNFDPTAVAGARKVIVKTFRYSKRNGPIKIKLKAVSGKTLLCGIELLVRKR